MSIFQTIKKQQLEARKAKNTIATNILTVILGEFARSASKDEPSDDQAFKVITKLRESVSSNCGSLPQTVQELDVLDALLALKPAAASEEEVKAELEKYLASNEKNMGAMMKYLKSMFGDTLDGKQASALVKSYLG